MKRIGFSKKYFTLWNVITTDEWKNVDGFFLPFKRTSFHYLKNLSTNEREAKRKAYLNGVQNFEVDPRLIGRDLRSQIQERRFSKKATDESEIFEFGEYEGQIIRQCLDLDFVFWYYGKTYNLIAKNHLLDCGFLEWNGHIVHADHFKKNKLRNLARNELNEKKEIKVFVQSNLNRQNEFTFEFKNELFHAKFNGNSKRYKYRSIEFFLPIIDGRPKRIKGKKMIFKIGKIEIIQ